MRLDSALPSHHSFSFHANRTSNESYNLSGRITQPYATQNFKMGFTDFANEAGLTRMFCEPLQAVGVTDNILQSSTTGQKLAATSLGKLSLIYYHIVFLDENNLVRVDEAA